VQRHWHWHKCVRFGETFWMSDARVTWKDIWGCCRILRFRDGGEKQRTLPNKRGDERQTNVLHSNSSGLVYMNCDIAAGMITKFVLFVYFSGGHIRVMWAHSGDVGTFGWWDCWTTPSFISLTFAQHCLSIKFRHMF